MLDINVMQIVINFLSLSAFYGLFAVGLALIFGVMKVVNFAHGEFFMLGGYALWLLLAAMPGVPLWLVFLIALVAGPLAVAVLGMLVERLIFEPTSDNVFGGFIASLGLSYVLQAVAVLCFGVVSKSLPVMVPGQIQIGGGTLTYQRLVVILGAVAMMVALYYFLYRTRSGRAVRAASQNRDAALLQGIDLRRVGLMTMAIGAAMAAVSGVLMGSVINVSPYMGLEAIWKAFIVVIVGGLGSIPGAIVAALLFGLIDSIATTLGYGQYVVIIDTVIMLVVLAFFPRGLLGREAPPLDQGQVAADDAGQVRPSRAMAGVLALAGAALLAGYPLLASPYYIGVGILFLINLILVISYRTVITMGGWSFAHITMLAIGAYATGMLQSRLGLSFWAILPLSGLVAAVVAVAIAVPVMRTRQFYFFLSTFAAGEAIRQCFIQFRGVFGGIEGIPFLSPPEDLFGLSFMDTTNYFYLALVVCVVSGCLLYLFDISRTGRTIRAMSENENLSGAIGLDAFSLKILAFALGAFFAGCAGSLFAGYNGFVAPTDFTTQFMFKIIAAVVIGGNRSFWGPILGLLVLTLIEELLIDANQLIPLFWGLTIIFTVLFIPAGLEGLVSRCLARRPLRKWRPISDRRDRDATRA
ncbi:branched-chain amino acid transport system permease protein [Paracoccus thiocyanatus]|uniref:Branched-chain amino acid transport system permease protein n=1 Tax=Paracoccus thiocyanatus TaxID=34006 RepID=A0A1N6U7F3_9RHOB|nr:ABC transporter permease [Paracoccus thiocyanatus]SIQ61618.1 branched-chain amino acid transport system permease protein [Paracoccus thiocyanatus]